LDKGSKPVHPNHTHYKSYITSITFREKTFTEAAFQNWRKAIDKFSAHESSRVHREAKIKWMAKGQPTIGAQMSSQTAQCQLNRRNGLLLQLDILVYFTRQGIPV